jgi:uncharacterized protein (DUF1015 family)
MAVIKPFKALRPIPEYAGKVAALPYDVMSSAEARELVKGNPYSFLHVDKAEIDLDESVGLYEPAVYAKARENLLGFKESGLLKQDDTSALYIYRLVMNGREQTGLVACTSVDEYISGKIKKHELTLESKEQDRIRHVEVCGAHTGPIFLTYRQQENISALIECWKAQNVPVYDFTADDGVAHTVWVIGDKNVQEALVSGFKGVDGLYIADGHHRNASAVKTALRRRAENPDCNGNEEYNYYLSVIFPSDQLEILSYNRIVKDLNGLSGQEFLTELSKAFKIEESGGTFSPKIKRCFGLYMGSQWYKLEANEESRGSGPVDSLDVSILQNTVLEPILGISDLRTDKRIGFVGGIRGLGELERLVDSGEWKLAFSMYPTSVDELLEVADGGMIMPPKSTWFEPKLRSGLFIHLI